jgi:hypothetical protein
MREVLSIDRRRFMDSKDLAAFRSRNELPRHLARLAVTGHYRRGCATVAAMFRFL